MLSSIAKSLLKLSGWKADLTLPDADKYVLIGAPHTSNWDFPLSILFFLATGLRFNWVGKHSMFIWPVSGIFKAMGGIPINRNASKGFIDQTAQMIKDSKQFILTIAPEGTRSRTDYWKTGFYYIAQQADVPVALGYLDYSKKTMGIGPSFKPSGNTEQDLKTVQAFYKDVTGKHPENQGPVIFRKR